MKAVPNEIDGAPVIWFALVGQQHPATGNCVHRTGNGFAPPASGLAICKYAGEEGFYLFGCDANWNCVTDTWHQSVEDAKAQAEFEYRGIAEIWNHLADPGACRMTGV